MISGSKRLPSFRNLSARLVLLILAGLVPCAAARGAQAASASGPDTASPQSAHPPALDGEISRLIRDLDSDQFAARRDAVQKLRHLVARPELAQRLSTEFQRVLLSGDTSFEVRSQLEPLRKLLPDASVTTVPGQASPEEIDRLLAQLEDDDYGKRLSASRRLQWLLDNPRMACPVLVRLKARVEMPGMAVDARQWLEPLMRQSRRAWLASDPALWNLPAVPESQIARWIDDLVRPVDKLHSEESDRARQRAARELRDLLARDEYVARLKQSLEELQQRSGLDPSAASQVMELLDLTRPAMVAECWGRVVPAMPCRMSWPPQRLIIGVPSLGPGAERPSHFDRIDDQTAHCVSGQNLTPGDYPVGIAFPHPKQSNYFFRLVNLVSPRRQMAYQYEAEVSQTRRLTELSRKTFDWILARKRPLSMAELNMLRQLDRTELSRFAGKFMALVDDEPVPQSETITSIDVPMPAMPADTIRPGPTRFGWPSRHGRLCEVLAAQGTREALPGLLRAIDSGRVLPPTDKAPYRLDALALLAIAGRDACPETDAVLAPTIGRNEPLIIGKSDPPSIGATAAGLLLGRAAQPPADFGLKPADESLLRAFGLEGFRYTASAAGEKVRQWWSDRKDRPDGSRAATP